MHDAELSTLIHGCPLLFINGPEIIISSKSIQITTKEYDKENTSFKM